MASKKATPNKRASEKQEADAQLRKVGRYLSGQDIAGSADSKARGAQARKAAMIRGVYGDAEERRLVGKKAPAKAKPVPKQASRVSDKKTVKRTGKASLRLYGPAQPKK